MKRYLGLVAALVALSLLSMVVARRAPAQGPPPVPNLIGHWSGITVSSLNQTDLPITVDLNQQHERLAQGTAEIGGQGAKVGTDVTVHVLGGRGLKIGTNATLQIFGIHSAKVGSDVPIHIEWQGVLVTLGDTLGVVANYMVGPAGNPTDQGALISVQCIGGQVIAPPDVTGCWSGYAGVNHGDTTMTASIDTEDGSALSGTMELLIPGDAFSHSYVFVGTISKQGAIQGVAYSPDLKGVLQYVSVSGQLQQDGSITGTLHWVFSGGLTKDAPFELAPISCTPQDR